MTPEDYRAWSWDHCEDCGRLYHGRIPCEEPEPRPAKPLSWLFSRPGVRERIEARQKRAEAAWAKWRALPAHRAPDAEWR